MRVLNRLADLVSLAVDDVAHDERAGRAADRHVVGRHGDLVVLSRGELVEEDGPVDGLGLVRQEHLVEHLEGAPQREVHAARPNRFAFFGEATEASRALLTTPLLVGMTLLSAVSWFCECLAAYVCVRGLGLDLSLADTVVAFSLGSLAGAASFLPGGLGVAEASMTGLIRVLGDTSRAAAAAATLLIRLATLWFAVALGLIGLAVESRVAGSSKSGRAGKARTS